MKAEDYNYIMVFTSHHRALYIYDRLLKKQIKAKLVSAPDKIAVSCTQAVKFKEIDMEIVQKELKRNNIYPSSIYKIISDGKNQTYELVE